MFVISLISPLQMKGPTMGPTTIHFPSLLEIFQPYPATSSQGVMPLQQTVGSPLYYTPLAWT
jgi:hypothetical protein